jgi:hypothetical protein
MLAAIGSLLNRGAQVSIRSAIKAASAKFAATFWRGFDEARAKSVARTQPVPPNPFESEAIKAALIDVVRGAYADGIQAERKRVETILQAPGASTFLEIAADLAVGPATAAQAAGVLARAEADAATRAGIIKSNLLDRASADVPTLH